MSRSSKLSPRDVRRARDLAEWVLTESAKEGLDLDFARGEARHLLLALKERRRVPRSRAPGKTKEERKRTKAQIERAVYEEVADRDAGLCTVQHPAALVGECDGPLQIDHQWGRNKAPTTVQNCRKLCTKHHKMKTDSEPSRALWLKDFRMHAEGHGYEAEADKATALRFLEEAQHPERAGGER